jgi:hypothetical protein
MDGDFSVGVCNVDARQVCSVESFGSMSSEVDIAVWSHEECIVVNVRFLWLFFDLKQVKIWLLTDVNDDWTPPTI